MLTIGDLRYFASGTGGAGLVGAFLWWELRGLGVRLGVGLSSVRNFPLSTVTPGPWTFPHQVLPFVIPITYFFILPRPDRFSPRIVDDDETGGAPLSGSYTRLPNEDDADDSVPITEAEATATMPIALSLHDKWRLARPMLTRYMLPLCKF